MISNHPTRRRTGSWRRSRFSVAGGVAVVCSILTLSPVSAGEPGSELWTARYEGATPDSVDDANAVAVSPDGTLVFVTGESGDRATTVAYDPATGAQAWKRRYDGPGGRARGSDLAVSPDGTTVFVTGGSLGRTGRFDYVTLAYDAVTGKRRWSSRYDGPGVGRYGFDSAYAIAVSPDGTTVFVTGSSEAPVTHADYATVAYDAATGDERWVQRYAGLRRSGDHRFHLDDYATSVAVSPDGSTVFVTGSAEGEYQNDYATLAYRATSGVRLWRSLYDGHAIGNDPGDSASSVRVSPDGSAVFVTGTRGDHYVTLAYRAATGDELWQSRYGAGGEAGATSLVVHPDGSTVFVTGQSEKWRGSDPGGSEDLATVAYDAGTGARLWARRFDAGTTYGAYGSAMAISPDGGTVFVTGFITRETRDYATVAYAAMTGERRWVERYDGPGHDSDGASAIAVHPDGTRVFVTGSSGDAGPDHDRDFATIAYAA